MELVHNAAAKQLSAISLRLVRPRTIIPKRVSFFSYSATTKVLLGLEQEQFGGHHGFQPDGQPVSNQVHAVLRDRLTGTVEGHPVGLAAVQPARLEHVGV